MTNNLPALAGQQVQSRPATKWLAKRALPLVSVQEAKRVDTDYRQAQADHHRAEAAVRAAQAALDVLGHQFSLLPAENATGNFINIDHQSEEKT